MLDQDQLQRIQDPPTRELVQQLAQRLEQALTQIDTLKAENQRLRDEIHRLQGEQGKPDIRPNKPASTGSGDHSSEKERRKPLTWTKSSKKHRIVLDRTQRLQVDPQILPPDAEFKGYERVVVQNLKLVTDNVCFERAKYYSPSTGKTYLAPLPPGYSGGFGPDLKALALSLHHVGNVSQSALHTLFTHAGISLSTGQISAFLTQNQESFHQEKQAIGLAGLASSPWQQTDDTATRVHGVNQHCHVLCNPLYTTFTTRPKKDRQTVLSVLQNGVPLSFLLTETVWASEAVRKLPRKWQKVLATWPTHTPQSQAQVQALLETTMPTLCASLRKNLLDQMALAGYQAQTQVPVVDLLVCDDAPQFRGLTQDLGLCWIHDARHYQKLTPHLPFYQQLLEEFKKQYWIYYERLRKYREAPTLEERFFLEQEFDRLFTPNTGYADLDARIQQTCANKANLLQVLAHPEIPLHNNDSELAARQRVRKRDVSLGPRSEAGVQAWDTFQTLVATAAKLGVSFLAYLVDRVSGSNEMPSLASMITERANELNLGASWN